MVLAKEREGQVAREAARKENQHKDKKYDGFTRFDGYCVRDGETEAKEEDWMPSGTSDIDSCAKGCSESAECSAFATYHEDGKCYFFKPSAVSRATGVAPEHGACFAKDKGSDDEKIIKPVLLAAAKDESLVASAVTMEEGADGEQKLYINQASKMIMSISVSAAGFALVF